MDPVQLVLAELNKRTLPTRLLDSLAPCQRKVADSTSRRIALLTRRRNGKSRTVAIKMLSACLKTPNTNCLWLALTYKNVKRIAFQELIKIITQWEKEHGEKIDVEFNKTTLTVVFPNGSLIECAGADNTKDIADRWRGTSYDIIAIDEAAIFDPDLLQYLIGSVLWPCLMDTRGQLLLVSTPSRIMTGMFYDITTNPPKHWDYYYWKPDENPYTVGAWKAEIAEQLAINPDYKNTAEYKREYLGLWTEDESLMVYKFSPLNLIMDAPKQNMTFILGLDIGWVDACAFTISGWAKHDSNLYVLESFKKSEMLPDNIAKTIKFFQNKYQPLTVIADSQNRTVIEDLSRRHRCYVIPAEKSKKQDWIATINADFLKGKVKICQYSNIELIKELSELPWLYKGAKREEHPAFDNHLTDALLYSYRYAWQYLEKPEVKLSEEERILQQELAQQKKKNKTPWWRN